MLLLLATFNLSTMATALLLGAEHPSLTPHPEKTVPHIFRFLIVVTEVVYNAIKVIFFKDCYSKFLEL